MQASHNSVQREPSWGKARLNLFQSWSSSTTQIAGCSTCWLMLRIEWCGRARIHAGCALSPIRLLVRDLSERSLSNRLSILSSSFIAMSWRGNMGLVMSRCLLSSSIKEARRAFGLRLKWSTSVDHSVRCSNWWADESDRSMSADSVVRLVLAVTSTIQGCSAFERRQSLGC